MGLKLPADGTPERDILNDVAKDVAELVMVKLQHSHSIKSYDANIKILMRNKHLDADYVSILHEFAADYEKGMALLHAYGYAVRYPPHDGYAMGSAYRNPSYFAG